MDPPTPPHPPPQVSSLEDELATTPRLALNGVWLEPPEDQREDEGEDRAALTGFLKRTAVVAGLGGFLFGFDTGIISSVLVTIGADLDDVNLSTGQEEAIVSATTCGALLGALFASQLADRIGRKKTLLGGSIFFALGAVEQSAARVYKEMVLGRVMVGIGVGLASMVLPVYCSELSPANFRGQIVTLLVVLITFGQVVAYSVGALFASTESGWRYMVLIGALPALVQLVLSIKLPESPRYLIQRNQLHQAHQVLAQIYPHLDDNAIERKVKHIERVLVAEQEAVVRLRFSDITGLPPAEEKSRSLIDALWRDLPNRRALILAMGLQFFQQATGFNTLMYYSGKILKSAGFARPATAAIFIAFSNFICTLISLKLIDRVGRRRILLRTLIGMAVSLLLTGFCFIFIPTPVAGTEGGTGGVAAIFALICMTAFCASYGLGLGNVPWIVQSEIFAYEVRSIGGGCATATNWLANLLVASTFLHLTELLTSTGTFWMFTLIIIGAWVFTWRFLPETKGLSIEECRSLFESKTAGLTRPLHDLTNGYQDLHQSEDDHAHDEAMLNQ